MDLKQHIPDKVLRDYLKGEAGSQPNREVSLHLSFCPTCQELRDAIVLDEVFGAAERQGVMHDGHIEDQVFEKFWDDASSNRQQLEEISRHCLICRRCRDRRYELWLKKHRPTEQPTLEAVAQLGIAISAIAIARRRRRRRIVLGIALPTVCALIFAVIRWENMPQPPRHEVKRHEGTPSPSPDITPNPTAVASATPTKESPRPRSVMKPRQVIKPPVQAKSPGNLWEQVAQNQEVNLKNAPGGVSFRGEDEEHNSSKARLIVVLSRARLTKLNIALPEKSQSGTYLISVQEPARLGTVAEGSAYSADGKALSVDINMRTLPAGEYMLCVTWKNEKTGNEEYLGHYPILTVDPVAKWRQGGSNIRAQ